MAENRNIRKFYDYLSKDYKNMPDYSDFEKTIQSPEKFDGLYNYLSKKYKNMPAREELANDLGISYSNSNSNFPYNPPVTGNESKIVQNEPDEIDAALARQRQEEIDAIENRKRANSGLFVSDEQEKIIRESANKSAKYLGFQFPDEGRTESVTTPKVPLRDTTPEYLTREPETFEEIYSFAENSWVENTEQGKKAYEELKNGIESTRMRILENLNEYIPKNADNVDFGAIVAEQSKPYIDEYNRKLYEDNKQFIDSRTDKLNKRSIEQEIGSLKSEVERGKDYLMREADELDKKKNELENRIFALKLAGYREEAEQLRQQLPKPSDSYPIGEEIKKYIIAGNYVDDSDEIRNAAIHGDGFVKGLGRSLADPKTWDFGITEIMSNRAVSSAVEKFERGDELSQAEDALLRSASVQAATLYYYNNMLSRGYKAGQVTGQSIPFMLQFAVSGGAGAAGSVAKGLLKFGLKTFGTLGKNAAARVGTKALAHLIGSGVAAAGMSATLGAGQVAAGAQQRMLGDIKPDFTDKGVSFGGRENMQGAGEAILHSAYDNFTEYFSEMALSGGANALGTLAKSIPAFSKTVGKLSGTQLGTLAKSIRENPVYKQLVEKTAFDGYISEVGEEYLGSLLRSLTDETTLADEFTIDNQIDTWLGLAPTSIFFGAVGGVTSGYSARQNRKNIREFREQLGNDAKKQLFDKMMSEIKDISGAENYAKFVINNKELSKDEKEIYLRGIFERNKELFSDEVRAAMRGQDIEEIKQNVSKFVDEITNKETNSIIAVSVGNSDEELFVVKGLLNFVPDKDGKAVIDNKTSDAYVYVRNKDGEIIAVNTMDIDLKEVWNPENARDFISEQHISAYDAASLEGERVVVETPDGSIAGNVNGGAASENAHVSENGDVSVEVQMPDGSKDNVEMTAQDAERILKKSRRFSNKDGSQEIEVVDNNDNTSTLYYENSPLTVIKNPDIESYMQENGFSEVFDDVVKSEGEDIAQNVNIENEDMPTAFDRIPKDMQGQPIYEQAESPDLAWEAIVEQADGDEEMAAEVVSDIVKEKEAASRKAEKALKSLQTSGNRTKADGLPMSMQERISAKKAEKEALAAALSEVDKAHDDLKKWEAILQTPNRRKIAEDSERRRIAEEQSAARRAEAERIRAEREEQERIEREALNGVPDIINDTPKDARARGYRRVNGYKVDRQELLEPIRGKEVSVKFSDDSVVPGHVAIIDAEQLQPSHLKGQRNPLHFIDEAQPKERKDDASVMSAEKIAGNIRPEEITSSVTAYTGAPTVNVRGEIIQGNNRGAALRAMWDGHPDQAEKYKQYLIDHSAEFGLNAEDVSAMDRPVLVNVADVSDDTAITLGQYVAQDTESGGVERIKPKNIVQKMGNDMSNFASQLLASSDEEMSFSELVDRNGLGVLKWMMQKGYISPTQYKSAFDSKGNLTAEAKNDLKGIMYQGIFSGGSTQLEEMFNELPAKAQKAILATAYRDYDSPNAERMNEEIQASISAYYALSQTPDFANAKNYKEAKQAVEMWERQYAMDDVTGESYLPSEKFSNFALLLATMYKGQTQTFIQNTFKHIYDLVQGTQEATLFDAPDNTPRTLVEAINETLSNLRKELLLNGNFIYNGQRRSNVLAGGSATGQQWRQGSDGSAPSGGRDESESRQTDNSRGTETDSELSQHDGTAETGNIRQPAPVDEKARRTSIRLNSEQCDILLAQMRDQAEVAPYVELNPTTWNERFGENGIINTPIGDVKMGESQISKFFAKGREKEFGMVAPTLSNPDMIIEKKAPAQNAERDTKLLFIKTFIKADGKRYVNFESVTVQKDGMEVSISSHEVDEKVVKKEMQNGNILHLRNGLPFGSEWYLTETPIQEEPDLVPTSDNHDVVHSVSAAGERAVTNTSEVNRVQSKGATAPAGNSSVRKDSESSATGNSSGKKNVVHGTDADAALSRNEPSDIDAKIDAARNGDKAAQRDLDLYGIPWQHRNVYRHVGQSEVDELRSSGKIKSRRIGGKIDVTASELPTTSASSGYRVKLKMDFDKEKSDSNRAVMKNGQLADGWITDGQYTLDEVESIERRNEDGSYTEIYKDNKWTDESNVTDIQPESLPVEEKSVSSQKISYNDTSYEVSEPISQGEHRTVFERDGGLEQTANRPDSRIRKSEENARRLRTAIEGKNRAEAGRIAEEWAKSNGLWTDYSLLSDFGVPFQSGNENDNYLSGDGYVYKVNNLMNSRGDLQTYLDGVELHNRLFPNSAYEFVGLSGFGNGSVYPVFRQQYVQNARLASPDEIDSYIRSLGFEPTGNEAEYGNGEIVVSDLRPRNVLKSENGNIYVVDAELKVRGEKSVESAFDNTRNKRKNAASAEKIEDVGEKIGGARKDRIKEYSEKIKDIEKDNSDILSDIAKLPLSKVYNFDYAALREEGVPNEVVTLIETMKKFIPSKPRTEYKLRRWVSNVFSLYTMALRLVAADGSTQQDWVNRALEISGVKRKYDAYMALGGFDGKADTADAELQQLDDTAGHYGSDGAWVSAEGKWYVSKAGKYGGIYDTKEEAVQALRNFSSPESTKVEKKIAFSVYTSRKDGKSFITIKGKPSIVIQTGFDTAKQAIDYVNNNYNDLVSKYSRMKEKTEVSFKDNREREGKDWRSGKDVTADEFMNTFGFRGVEFGNWTNQSERQNALNRAFDALMDLSEAIGKSPSSLSLNGELAIAFGARGGGKAAAHYEPGRTVINLTKTQGAGSLAHEWWHAVDNYFAKRRGEKNGFNTEREGYKYDRERKDFSSDKERKEITDAFKKLVHDINASDYGKRSSMYASLKSSYWKEPTELGARAFASWVERKLSEKGIVNDYLSNNPIPTGFEEYVDSFYPYPIESDFDILEGSFDNLFNAIQEKVDEETGNVVLFNIAPVSESTMTESQQLAFDAVSEMLNKAGIPVEVMSDEEMGRLAGLEDASFEAKRKSESRQKRDEVNQTIDKAVSYVTGKGTGEVRSERMRMEQARRDAAKEIYDSVLRNDFNSVVLQQINDYIDDATPKNPYGRRISQRVPQAMERSLHEGNRTNAVDALFTRISESSVGNAGAKLAGDRSSRESAKAKKKELLKGWAIATGNWHTDIHDFTNDIEPIASGKDSDVYYSKDGRFVIKFSRGKDGKRFTSDIDAANLFGFVFPNTAYDIVGYGEINGEFVTILRQPVVDIESALTEGERVEYMRSLGYHPINKENTAFSNGEIVVSDLQKGNIVRGLDGNIYVIDADVKLHTRDMGGNYTYPPASVDTEDRLTSRPQLMTVYHGSGAEFYAFDEKNLEIKDRISFMRGKKKASETVLPEDESSFKGTVVSDADGTKVLNNLDNVAKEYDKFSKNRPWTFLGDVAKALGARQHGSKSQYATFETVNGQVVTIRLSDHNASTRNFDNAGRENGISIVISRKPNQGITNDGNARLVEFFYPDKALQKAEGKPLAEIVRSIKQALYSGEYTDTTGLAEVQEVNGTPQEVRNGVVYGATVGGKIYMNGSALNPETPIHEYTHIWDIACQKNNPELWNRGVELMKQTPMWDDVKNDPNYADLKTDDEIASEVHSRLTGKDGTRILEDMAEQVKKDGTFYEIAKTNALISKLKKWLSDFWYWLKDTMAPWTKEEAQRVSLEDFINMPLKDLARGTDLRGNGMTAEEIRIIEEAKSDGTYMKAPNGNPTNLTERQWAQVRTKAFKEWFGDWEKSARIEKLRESKPLEVNYNGEYELDRKSAKEWLRENVRGEYTNADTGDKIGISRVGINEVTSHGSQDEAHLKSLICIPQMIEHSVFIDEISNSKDNDKYDSYRYYVCGLKIDGMDYTAKIVVGVKGDRKYYDHRLTEIEKGKLIDNLNGLSNSVAENQNAPIFGKDTKLVSLLQTNSSKVVDENGEPMVVYHGSSKWFTVFNDGGERKQSKAPSGSIFATDDREVANSYMAGKWYGESKGTLSPMSNDVYLDEDDPRHRRTSWGIYREGGIYPLFMKLKNPLIVDFGGKAWYDLSVKGKDVNGIVSEEMDSGVHDGVIVRNIIDVGMTDLGLDKLPATTDFVAFSPNQVKSATGNTGDFDASKPDIRFRISEPYNPKTETISEFASRVENEFNGYDRERIAELQSEIAKESEKASNAFNSALKTMYDIARPLEKFQDMFAKQGALLDDRTDAYSDFFRSKARVSTALNEFEREKMKPIYSAISSLTRSEKLDNINDIEMLGGDKINDARKITLYLQAKDIVEAKEKGLVDRGEEGFSEKIRHSDGVTKYLPEEYVYLFESNAGDEMVADLWSAVRNATKWIMDYQLEYGFVSQEKYDELMERQYYVPQRGFEEDEEQEREMEKRKAGQSSSVFNSALKKAKGRKTLADDPIPYIFSIAQSTAFSVEKNRTKQKAYNFVMANLRYGLHTGEFYVDDVHYEKTIVDGNLMYKPVYGYIPLKELFDDMSKRRELKGLQERLSKTENDEDAQYIREEIERLENEIRYESNVAEDLIIPSSKENQDEHRVRVVINGRSRSIYFKNKDVAAVLNRSFSSDYMSFTESAKMSTSYMSRIYTQLSPAFGILNLFRDYPAAIISNIAEGYGQEFVVDFLKNTAKTMPTISRYVFSGKMDGKYGEYLNEFFKEGAQTGYSYMFSIEKIRIRIEREMQGKGEMSNLNPLKLISSLGEFSELVSRFTQYVTAREHGYSAERAATMAKEITVNFDRRGNLPFFYSYISFFNARMQGTYKFVKLLAKNKTARRVLISTMSLYMVSGFLNTLLSPDDPDDEKSWTDWDRMQNFIIGSWKIPIPPFFRAFWAIGVQGALAYKGKKTSKNALFDAVSYFTGEMLPLNPFDFLQFDSKKNMADIDVAMGIRQFVPTVASPVYDVVTNRTFTGGQIHKEPYVRSLDDITPQTTLARNNVNPALKWFTDYLYELGGGNLDSKRPTLVTKSGDLVSPMLDINPSDIQHLVSGYFGGLGTFVSDLYAMGCMMLDTAFGDGENTFDDFTTTIPVINRLYKPYDIDKPFNASYWELKGRVEYIDKLKSSKGGLMHIPKHRIKLYNEAKIFLGNTDYKNPKKSDLKKLDKILEEWNKTYWKK